MIAALLLKELRHHGAAIVGFTALVLGGLTVAVAYALDEQVPTLLSAGTGFAYYAMPLLAMFVNRRLIVLEREDRTHELIASLPVSPLVVGALRYAIGLAITWAVGVVALLAVALLVSRHEVVTGGFVAQLVVQVSLYLFGWQSVCFAVGHLGQYRWLAWVVWLFGVDAIDDVWPAVWTRWQWHAILIDPIHQAMIDPPWHAIPVAVAWGVGGLAAGLGLASWRGGALPARWFAGRSGRTGFTVGAGAACVAVSILVGAALDGGAGRGVAELDATRAHVAVAAAEGRPLHAVAVDAAATLDALGEALDVESWPAALLVADRQLDEAANGTIATPMLLRVDPDAPHDDAVRAVVDAVVLTAALDAAVSDPVGAGLVRGTAAWWRGADDLVLRRAGLAAWLPDQDDATVAIVHAGDALSEGYGWAGLTALEEAGGRDAALSALRAMVHASTSETALGVAAGRWRLRGDWLAREAGVDASTFATGRRAVLDRHRLVEGPGAAAILRTPARDALRVTHDSRDPDAHVAWVRIDPLEALPRPYAVVRRRLAPPAGAELALLEDPHARIAARVEVWRHDVRGWVGPPFTVLEVPP